MSWNYRVIHTVLKGEYGTPHQYAVHEVYYNKAGSPISVSVNPIAPVGETLNELKNEMEHYMKALKEPILQFADFKDAPVKKRGDKKDAEASEDRS